MMPFRFNAEPPPFMTLGIIWTIALAGIMVNP
jgi:hypothetical protein